ncbi:DNA-binding response regulator [Gordonibacter sp. 28C]|uniref:response regulator transcription factor n=1 Tax=Gordonibacter sp. 28C TaxID=2078569 RepID=UPI000DF76D21|nr:response regulator transcription factor [Gordonibacter sp. 28C]RDB61763.1 DNA-binding response regulator [Gordonibacter sp. 28C]
MPSILIVDDDADLSAIVARYLESEGFAVERAASAEEAYDVLGARAFDLVLLDINLPGDDGFAACAALRRASDVPVIFASARTSETDRIEGLDTGGDDYLPKPYSLRELLAHVNALLRRAQGHAGGMAPAGMAAGPFALDEGAGILAKEGEPVPLSPKELALAAYLMRHEGAAVSKERLLAEVWGAFSEVEPQTVSVHMSWLRAKLEDDPAHPAYFKTVRGKGYLFDAGGGGAA